MKYGYARVSTTGQNLDAQAEQLKIAGCEVIFEEKHTATVRNRPKFNKLMSLIAQGDALYVVKLDRLVRSANDYHKIIETIAECGATFHCLASPELDYNGQDSGFSKAVRAIAAAFAELERDLIVERTQEGRKRAIERGVRMGRPPTLNKNQQRLVLQYLREGKQPAEVARLIGVSHQTITRLRDRASASSSKA